MLPVMMPTFVSSSRYEGFVYNGVWPPPPSYENMCHITLCCFSLVGGALVLSHGAPFRQPVYSNCKLTILPLLDDLEDCRIFIKLFFFYQGISYNGVNHLMEQIITMM